jgi:RNA polymerase sigma-70 factor (ECF subfamily)
MARLESPIVDAEDRLLFERARSGDGEALGALLARHLPGLRAYVSQRLGPLVRAREDTGDVVQSVCRELLQGLAGFEYQGEAAFRSWLCTAAVRKIVEKHARYGAQRRDARRDLAPDPARSDPLATLADGTTPSERAIAAEELERLERAFRELSAEHREVILLARVADLSHAEIARRLGKSEGAARTLLHRALAKLASRVELEQPESPA